MLNTQDSHLFLTTSSRAFIAAGFCTAAFWLTTLPFDSFAGIAVAQHPLFVPGQILHIIAAALTALGLCSVYVTTQLKGHFALASFLLCFFGSLAFLADAAIALVTFPALAASAPELIASDGLMNTGWVFSFFVGFAVVQMFGYIGFGITCWLSEKLPKDGCALLILGGVMTNLPPMPGLHWLWICGGLLWSAGVVRLGLSALKQSNQPTTTAS